MSDSAQVVLREYLLSLGFKADPVSQSRFLTLLGGIDKKVLGVGKGLIGIATAAAGMVAAFTSAAEKAYYASRLGQSSVSNMKAAAYAGKQIGLTADQVNGAILSMSMAIRNNPGTQALIESFIGPIEGRDMSDVMVDVVKQWKQLEFFLGSKFAGEAGLDPQTYFLLADGLDKYVEAQKKRKEMEAAAGVDEDKFSEASVKYQNALNTITEKIVLLGKKMAVYLLPFFERLNDIINKSLDFWTKWSNKIDELIDKVQRVNEFFRKAASWNPLMRWLMNQVDPRPDEDLANGRHTRVRSGVVGPNPNAPRPPSGGGVDFSAIEQRYGLPTGVLERMWQAESGKGKYMLSPKGAQGHFGIMPGTAPELGVTDPNDLGQSANGAGLYLSRLYKKYGDWSMALAAYNWGQGKLDSKGIGAAPEETRKYMHLADGLTVGGPQTTIIINGAQEPTAIANQVEEVLDRQSGEWVRNFQDVLR